MAAHCRPFVVDDGEHHGVARRTVGVALVVAQHAILFCAQPRDGGARGMVEPTGFETDANAAHRLERMPQQQQLGFSIQAAALHAPLVPGVADVQARHACIQCVVAGTAHYLARRVLDHERQRRCLRLRLQRRSDITLHITRRRHVAVPAARQFAIAQCLPQRWHVRHLQRLQHDVPAMQFRHVTPCGMARSRAHPNRLALRLPQCSTKPRMRSKSLAPNQNTFQ